MTWSYSGNPANSDLDKIRYLCGDTNTNNQLQTDEEINSVIADYPNHYYAAAEVCDAIAAKLSFDTDTTNSGLSVAASKRAEAFTKRAKELRAKVGRSITFTFGGQSISGRDTARADTDTIQPSFEVGMHDYDQNDDGDNDLIID